MSVYSQLLQQYIKNKDIKVAHLTEYCGVERSHMYKIINGKRKLVSIDIARKIAQYLQLTPHECLTYYETYYQTLLGEKRYLENQLVEDFIYDFSKETSNRVFVTGGGIPKYEIVDHDDLHILYGEKEINYHLKSMLELECQNEHPQVLLLTQCDNDYLLQTLVALGKKQSNLKIQHIICFQKHDEQSVQNIQIIKKIVEFYKYTSQYEPYYYYDDVSSHFHNMNLFSNCVICGQDVLCYTTDLSYGQFIHHQKCVEVYQNLFQDYLQSTYPVFTKVDSIIQEYITIGQSVLQGFEIKAYSLHAEPCVIPFIDQHLLKQQIHQNLFQDEKVLDMFSQYIQEEYQVLKDGKFCCYFTLEGVKAFIQDGRISEIPQYFYKPLERIDCLNIMQKMLPFFADGKYRLLKNRLADIQNDLHVFVAPSTGHFLFSNNQNELVYLYINEPQMIEQFYQFMESLNEDVSLYTTSQAVELIENIIKEYK